MKYSSNGPLLSSLAPEGQPHAPAVEAASLEPLLTQASSNTSTAVVRRSNLAYALSARGLTYSPEVEEWLGFGSRSITVETAPSSSQSSRQKVSLSKARHLCGTFR